MKDTYCFLIWGALVDSRTIWASACGKFYSADRTYTGYASRNCSYRFTIFFHMVSCPDCRQSTVYEQGAILQDAAEIPSLATFEYYRKFRLTRHG